MTTIISVENLSKSYRLGQIGTGTLTNDLKVWWARTRGKPNPLLKIGQTDHGNQDGETLWALHDVSFTVQQGEVLGVIGRNGAGKSTLLKILSRVTAPTSGCVKVKGRIASLLEVGTGFHPELTGRENIYLNGAILGMTKQEIARKFDEIVAFAEVEKFIDTPVKRYSSGMYVRLAFAVAAHLESEILLVDEVLAVGDAEFQKKCLGKMGDVATNEGRTVLFVSHNMAAVEILCDRCILIGFGKIATAGLTRDVINSYLGESLRSESGYFDCTNHPARKTKNGSIIQSITLSSDVKNNTNTYFPNSPLLVKLNIKVPKPLNTPRFAIAIEDNFGRRIFTVASYFQLGNPINITDSAEIYCKIPKLPLGTGQYLISVSVASKYDGLIDSIDGAGWFSIEWNNSYGNGENYFPVYGPILIDSIWGVNE